MTNEELTATALAYGDRGWHVIPLHTIAPPRGLCTCPDPHACDSPGKHPLGSLVPHGLSEATTDPKRITDWWTRRPGANIGIVTGRLSGLVVLDVDPHRGGDQTLLELQSRYGMLPDTLTALTGGGGAHYYFAHPMDRRLKNSSDELGPGLDVRADGGYVCFTAGHRVVVRPRYKRYHHSRLEGIENIVPGDVLAAYDEQTGEIVDTVVQETSQRQVRETYVVKFGHEKGAIRLTPDLPGYTTQGWKRAADLVVGDELFHISQPQAGLAVSSYHAPKGSQPNQASRPGWKPKDGRPYR